jgi:hypothetical protein
MRDDADRRSAIHGTKVSLQLPRQQQIGELGATVVIKAAILGTAKIHPQARLVEP